MTEHVDVVIVGAGISGVSAAWHLQDRCPTKSYADPGDARENLGGTWDLFKYPGHPLRLRHVHAGLPVQAVDVERQAIADGPSILELPQGSGRRERHRQAHPFQPQAGLGADWSDADNRWTLTRRPRRRASADHLLVPVRRAAATTTTTQGYTPEFAGSRGLRAAPIVHPQHWPEDLDYHGKKIVVIGSGATAVTLIPALVEFGRRARHHAAALADLHRLAARRGPRSPTRIEQAGCPRRPPTSRSGGRAVAQQHDACTRLARKFPNCFAQGPAHYGRAPAARRATTSTSTSARTYNPWDQRLCLAPNGDLFQRHPQRARPTSSPTPSSGSPRPASS